MMEELADRTEWNEDPNCVGKGLHVEEDRRMENEARKVGKVDRLAFNISVGLKPGLQIVGYNADAPLDSHTVID